MDVPRLRFKEFQDIWIKKRIGDIGESFIGLTYSPKDVTDDESFPIILRSSNIQEGRLAYNDIVRVKSNIRENIFVKENDILICARNGSKRLIGKNVKIPRSDEKMAFGAFMSVYRSPMNEFISQLFCTAKYTQQIQENLGATINQITTKNLNSFTFYFPKAEEQQKISLFLSSIDAKIENLTRQCELLIQYKKGVMQKIFNQEIRFKDKAGEGFPEWQSLTFDDVCIVNMGQSPESSSYNEDSIGMPLIQGNADIYNRLTVPRIWTSQPTKTCDSGDLILTVRAPVGAVSKSTTRACIGRGVCSMSPKENTSRDFIYQLLFWFESFKWKSIEQGSTFTAISGGDIRSLKVEFPCFEEQVEIAKFLDSLDLKINSVKSKLELTKQYKQGLLQQMFV